ncbi:MAG: DUF4163 domain-containing protein [Alphaproteobacteria bacterium]|nr:DUF4163 domain-containing protein [Alphaproteobacteria bacterium]
MRVLAFVLVLCAAGPALAQGSGASFDCAKASTAIERTICKEPELAKADRDMAAAFTSLEAKLSGPAKEALLKDQQHWIADRNRGCAADTDGIVPCLKVRYAARLANLRALGEGAYPFISQQALDASGTLGKITWSYDISYPEFDGKTADFGTINAKFAEEARKAADEATPRGDSGPDRKQRWTYDQVFKIHRPGADAVTVAVEFYGYSGGAHGYSATQCTLVDLRTGKAVDPAGVFAPGDEWLRGLISLVAADLKKQFVDKPGFDDALEPNNLAKLLREPGHYCWRPGRLELIFNAYEVGPYVSGSFEVELSYDKLKSWLRPGGPIAP